MVFLKKWRMLVSKLMKESIILRRDINEAGKSVCRVNGKLVTIGILREIGSSLIDIHGQHESQELMDEKAHIHLLDQFAGDRLVSK